MHQKTGFSRGVRKFHLIITFLALLTLFLVLETLILAHEYRQSMVGDVIGQFYKQQVNVARQTAAGIEKFLEDIMRDLELLSQYPYFQGAKDPETKEILRQFYEKNRPDTVHIYRLDREGNMTHIHPESSARGESFAYRTYFKETKRTLKPYVSRFLLVREHYWTLVLAYPILINKNAEKPRFAGVVAATISVEQIRNRFIIPITLAKTGYGWVLDGQGTVIIHPIHPDLEGSSIQTLFNQEGEAGLGELTALMKRGQTNIGKYTYRHVTKYAAFSPFRLGNQICSVAVCAPIDEMKQFMQNTFGKERILLIFIIVVLIGAGGSVIFLVRRIYNYRMEERSRSQLMEILRSMHEGVCILGPDYFLETLNPALAKTLGTDEKNLINQPCYSVFMGRGSACPECPLEQTWNRGGPAYAPKRLTPPTGEPFSADVFTLPLIRSHEDRPHVFCYLKDLTAETILKRKLTQSKKLASLGEVAAGIAHEMRNPLVSIRSASEMLLDSPNHDEEEKTLSEIIHKEAAQMERIIREIVAYAQPPRLDKSRVQLNDVVREILRQVGVHKDFGPSILLEIDLDEDLPVAYLDRLQFSQVLWNLFQNARDAIEGEGTIRVFTFCESWDGGGLAHKSLCLVVADTGKGLDEETMGEIFKPFFTTKSDGLGMGLALVQQIIEAHDGEIRVESQPGEGSKFTIRLPLIS